MAARLEFFGLLNPCFYRIRGKNIPEQENKFNWFESSCEINNAINQTENCVVLILTILLPEGLNS